MPPVVRTLAMLLALPIAHTSHAAEVVLWPVDPTIAAGQRSTAIWIENRGSMPVTMQVRSLDWRQADGEDDYASQDAIVSSPPIAEIAPGARQLIRVIRRVEAPGAGEHAYRMLIDEIPAASKAESPGANAALAVQMRYSIPLFTYGTAEAGKAQLAAKVVIENGRRFVEIRNVGTRHARLTDLRRIDGSHTSTLMPGLVGYVLPGAMRRFALPDGTPATGRFAVLVDGVDQSLTGSI